jgi:hypothetical protein
MNTKKDRLNEVYEHLRNNFGIHTKTQFASVLKITQPALSSAMNGNEAYLTKNLFHKICATYPGVFDLNYLLTGEGSLLAAHGGDTTQPSGESDEIWAKNKTIESLKETIAALEAEIERLKESNNVEIEYLKRKIQIMEMDADAVRIQHRMDLEKANIMSIPK